MVFTITFLIVPGVVTMVWLFVISASLAAWIITGMYVYLKKEELLSEKKHLLRLKT